MKLQCEAKGRSEAMPWGLGAWGQAVLQGMGSLSNSKTWNLNGTTSTFKGSVSKPTANIITNEET